MPVQRSQLNVPDSPDTGSDIICPPCSQQGAAAGAQAGSQAGAQAGAMAGELPHPQGERNSMNEGVRLQPPPDPPIQLQPGAARRPPMSTARHIFRDIFPLHQKLDIPEPHQSFGAVADDSAKPYLTIRATPADTTDFF